MTISVFFKKTAMVKLAFLDRSMTAQQHSNSLPWTLKIEPKRCIKNRSSLINRQHCLLIDLSDVFIA